MAQSDTFQAGWGGSSRELAATGWDSLERLADAAEPLGDLAGRICTTACPELELLAFDTGVFNLWRFVGGHATCSDSSDPPCKADPPEPAPGNSPPDAPVQHRAWNTEGGGGAKPGGTLLTGGDCTTALLAFELEELDAHAFGG